MRRVVAVLAMLGAGVLPMLSEGAASVSIAGATVIESSKSGGVFEVGPSPMRTNRLDLAGCLTLAGYGSQDAGLVAAGGKLAVGARVEDRFRVYGFIGAEVGLYGTTEKAFTEAPLQDVPPSVSVTELARNKAAQTLESRGQGHHKSRRRGTHASDLWVRRQASCSRPHGC